MVEVFDLATCSGGEVPIEDLETIVGEGAFVSWERDVAADVELLQVGDAPPLRFVGIRNGKWVMLTGARGHHIALWSAEKKKWLRRSS